jgi:hypothetical protein
MTRALTYVKWFSGVQSSKLCLRSDWHDPLLGGGDGV